MNLYLLAFLLIICNFCNANPAARPEERRITFRQPKQFRRTFHVEKSRNVQTEDSSPDSQLKFCPDYDRGVFSVELFNLEIIENTPCKLVFNEFELETKSTEYICKWTSDKFIPGHWYHFKAWITISGGQVKRVSNSWDAVEPAFDVDQFGITVASKETSLEVNLDPSKTADIWDALIGGKGLLMVTLIDGEKKITKTVSKAATKLDSPMVAFTDLTPKKCYTVEVYTTVDNIASYNRTWFDVRTGSTADAGFTLKAKEITCTTAEISIKSSNLDPSCKVILTVLDERAMLKVMDEKAYNPPQYQYMENQTSLTVIDLKPMHQYVIVGASQCGGDKSSPSSSNDLCEIANAEGTTEVSFETYPDLKKL